MVLRHAVIDGSNIATEGRDSPSLAQLDEGVRAFLREYEPEIVTVVVDATFPNRIDRSERQAYEEALIAGELVTPPAGAVGRGDAFLLQIADRTGATVLSNDSFQEFHGAYAWLFDDGRLIGGKPVPHVGWVFMGRAPVRGPTSRRAISAAKRAQTTKPAPTTKAARASKATNAGRSPKKASGAGAAPAAPTEAPSGRAGRSRKAAPSGQAAGAATAAPPGRAVKAAASAKDSSRSPADAGQAAAKDSTRSPARAGQGAKGGDGASGRRVVRLHELAKELGLTNKECLDLCQSLGIGVKTHSSGIKQAEADRVRQRAKRDGLTRDRQPDAPRAGQGGRPRAAKGAAGRGAAKDPAAAVAPKASRSAGRAPEPSTMAGQPTDGSRPAKRGGGAPPSKAAKASKTKSPAPPSEARASGDAAKGSRSAKATRSDKAVQAAEAAKVAGRGDGGGGKGEAAVAYNEALPFIEFVGAHPVGSRVDAVVEEFSSHGAYVRVDGVRAYVPLRYLGEPPPRSAKAVLRLGESRQFVVVEVDPARRGVDVALPDVAPPPPAATKKAAASMAAALRRVLRR